MEQEQENLQNQAPSQVKKRSKPLTARERRLFKALVKGKSITDAALEAGYSDKYPNQAGRQAIERIKNKSSDLFARHGLDDDSFILKHIKPALEATEVKVFNGEHGIVYSEPLIAWGPRTTTNRLVAEMKGMINRDVEQGSGGGIKVLIINGSYRPPRDNGTEAGS